MLRPFLSALIWATMIVIPTWPLMLWFKERLGGRRGIAVVVMGLILSLVVLIPVGLAVKTIVEHTETITEWAHTAARLEIPAPPAWISEIPFVGSRIATRWENLAISDRAEIAAKITPYLVMVARWFPAQLGNVGVIFIHLLLTMIISMILYWKGEIGAHAVRIFARRLAGEQGEQVTILAAQAIKAVAMGIVVTALVQSAVAGIGLGIAGMPQAVLLTALIFFLSIVQIGAGPVLIPTIIWLYWSGSTAWGTFILIWSVVVMGLDNFLRPFLIKKGADLPILLIFAGVIGGLMSFGIIGLFIGPVVLAVSYTLIKAWVGQLDSADEAVVS